MQLVAYGAQDVYLTSNPTVTFFKVVYRRHTNFAMESIEQTFSGAVDFGRKVSATVSRNADLIHKTYLEIGLPALSNGGAGTVAWVRNIGNVIIKEVSVSIGGSQIDKHYGQWLHIWNQLTQTAEHEITYNELTGNTDLLTVGKTAIPATTISVPLQFWFNRNVGLALPLIALAYHEVKFDIEFRPFSECYQASALATPPTPVLANASLWINYIYLDTAERRQFAQITHEYLIEQLQFQGAESVSQVAFRQRLTFNHPCKELVWVAQPDANVANVATSNVNANRWTDFTTGSTPYAGPNTLVDAKLQLNGHDRFATRKANYFNLQQPLDHHTNGPAVGIYVYSFALSPEEHQPSGSINMSRIDNATMQMTLASSASSQVFMYATNYNILRIMSGIKQCIYIHLCLTVSCIISSAITYYEKQCKLAGNHLTVIPI
jgi:hypothetical protein